jgi:hypothetical protein
MNPEENGTVQTSTPNPPPRCVPLLPPVAKRDQQRKEKNCNRAREGGEARARCHPVGRGNMLPSHDGWPAGRAGESFGGEEGESSSLCVFYRGTLMFVLFNESNPVLLILKSCLCIYIRVKSHTCVMQVNYTVDR